jgi:threonine/homoserine/homoserine lactone efflux protein
MRPSEDRIEGAAMDWKVWLMYSLVAQVSIASPGPAVLLAVTNGVTLGTRRVALSSLGNICGIFIVASLAMSGLGALLKASSLGFGVLKVLGAAYLLYLGVRQWRSKTNIFAVQARGDGQARTRREIFMQAFLLALTNPKAILFFTALFPQFLAPARPLLPQFLILTFTFMALSFTSLMLYGLLARSARGWFAEERRATWFNRTAGGLYAVLGAGLLRLKHAAV